MIRITTDKRVKEEIEEELNRERDFRYLNQRIEHLEKRMYELDRRLDKLVPSVIVDTAETVACEG